MESTEVILDIIRQSHGTDAYHRFSPIPDYPIITDGVLAVAETADCFWLLDIIGSYQGNAELGNVCQVWTLDVNHENGSAIVRGYNDETLIITQDIPYTDFPLDELKLYLMNGVIFLLSEH